jgi:hypothetical protein
MGALVLGIGLGLLFSDFLKPYAEPLLLAGILAHACGMFDKHRLEKASESARQPLWTVLLYWVCWVALLALIAYVGVNYLRR